MSKLVLIDGNSIMNRAFYGIMGKTILTAPNGMPTNAILGFLAIMFRILENIEPDYVGVAFDLKAPTKRHKMYSEYKANRHGMPDDLAIQMPVVKDILKAMNINIIEQEGYEADDILGTLAKKASRRGIETIILTGDRDAFQLASKKITIRIPRTKGGKTEEEDFDERKIIETYGVKPKQLIDVKGLMGDKSDNIPGVAGIGEKTALTIIKQYKTIENFYENLENGKVDYSDKLTEKLREGKEMAYLSKELGTIDVKAEIDVDIKQLEKKEWNEVEVYNLFSELQFNKYIDRFNLHGEKKDTINIDFEEVEDLTQIKEHIMKNKIMFFNISATADNSDELIIKKKIKKISIYTDNVYVTKNCADLKEIFENKEVLKCGANLRETYILLKQIGIEPKNFMYDIEIAGYILNSISTKYDINSLANTYLNIDISAKDGEAKQISLFENQEEKDTDENFAISSYCVYKLYEILAQKLKETEQWDLFEQIEMPLLEVLAEMQYTGMYIDKDALVHFGENLDGMIEEVTQEIYKLSGEEFNINSPRQLGEVLFEKLKLPTQKKTKSGYSTDVAVLEKLYDKHPVIQYLLEYRQLAKLKTTFVSGVLPYINKSTGRIHSNFNQTTTATGRISSSEPNLQNIPTRIELGKQLRKVFVGEGENILVDADYSQIELRVLADIANDEKMIKAFEEGRDIHREVASQVFKTDNPTEEQRTHAKAVNFGIVYGISDFGLGEQLHIDRKAAKEYIEQYLSKYKDINNFMENIINYAKENGYVETKFKRRRYIPELSSKNYMVRQFGSRVAMNMPIQGTAADIMKIAMINIYNRLKSENLKAKLILQVHDEIIIETPEDENEKVKEIIQDCMQNACKLSVPLKVDIKSGRDWYTAK